MIPQTPSALLVQTLTELGLDRQDLGFSLGAYKNPLKTAGSVRLAVETLLPRGKLLTLPNLAIDTRLALCHWECQAPIQNRPFLLSKRRR